MKQKSLTHVNREGLSRLIFRQKINAFLVSTAAIFCLTLVCWSMSVRGFVSQSEMRLKVIDGARLSQSDLEDRIEAIWQQQISDGQLDLQMSDDAKSIDLEYPMILEGDFDHIRQFLSYQIRHHDDEQYIDVSLFFEGDGSIVETEFVTRLAGCIATQIAALPANVRNLNDLHPDDRTGFVESQTEYWKRIQHMVGQFEQDMSNVRRLATQLTTIDTKSFAKLPRWDDGSDEFGTTKSSQFDPFTNQDSQSASQRIHGIEPERGGESVFKNASHPNHQTSSMDRMMGALNAVDVISLRSTLMQMKDAFDKRNQLAVGTSGIGLGATNRLPPVVIQSVKPGMPRPVGGLPGAFTIMSLLMLSGLIGSVVAWGFSPIAEDRGFRNSQEVETRLKLAVVSRLVRGAGEGEEHELPICNLILECARLSLLAFMLIVITGLVLSPAVRESFADNPLNGLCRITWNFLGK